VKSVYVAELQDGDDLNNEPFLIEDVVKRETKDGRPYLLCTFRDKTGQIGGVFWNVPEDVESWVQQGIVSMVTGRVRSYRNSIQITTTDLNPQSDADMSLFLPTSNRSIDDMVDDLKSIIDELDEPWKELVSALLLKPEMLSILSKAPAARMMHHAYIGGLLEHTLNMAQIGKMLASQYSYVNKDLLLAGILLHDMGKSLEYDTSGSFNFTDDGRLVGHVVRAAIMVEKAAAELDNISEEDLREIVHLILSHHGQLEWGAPVVPKTVEAVLLHQIDLLDSRMQGFIDHVQNDQGGGRWTSRQSYMFDTELRRP
jgi:3'-5' exoribonuclease